MALNPEHDAGMNNETPMQNVDITLLCWLLLLLSSALDVAIGGEILFQANWKF